MILHILALVFLTFLTRIVPRIFRPMAISTDTYYHLLSAESIRNNRFRIPRIVKGFCFPSPYDYPPVFPYLLAIFNEQLRERFEKYISAFMDVILVLIMYFLTDHFFKYYIHSQGASSSSLAFIFSGLYLLSPALLFFGFGPRAYQATPRVISELLYFISMFSLFSFHFYGNILAMVVSIISSALLLLSSKFGLQVLLFFSIIMSIFLHSWHFLLLLFSGFVTAIIITKGFYLEVLRGQIGHLILFKKITSKVYPYIQRKNKLQNILTLPKDILFDIKRAFGTVIFNNSFIILLVRNPQLIILFFGIIFIGRQSSVLTLDIKVYFLLIWILTSLIVFFFTSLRPFYFLGEAERYMNYSLIPQYMLVGLFLSQNKYFKQISISFFLYSIGMYILYVYIFIRWYAVDKETEVQKKEAFNFLKTCPWELRILPIVEDVYELAYKSKKDVLYPPGNYRIDYISVEEFKKIYELFEAPNRNIKYILNKYNLNSIFVSNRQLKYLKNNFGVEYDFCEYRKIFDNKKYSVYLTQ